jgi:uncharacterized membrane protein YgcG
MKKPWLLLVAVLLAACLCPFNAFSDDTERILQFHSHIVVHADASMTVNETIKVLAKGEQIKRGIFRDFPTRYKDKLGNNYVVDFTVKEILRDGKAEAYRIEDIANGARIYLGKKDVFLSPGEYTYSITYQVNGELGFFKYFDELYWNVTGNGWAFWIDEASATVELPRNVGKEELDLDAYTGYSGEKGKAVKISFDAAGRPTFVTTGKLAPQQGLTIVVDWPKGAVSVPSAQSKLQRFFKQNISALLALLGFIAVFIYYLRVWSHVGRDPVKGVIVPLYSPPDELSPAAMRFIIRMGYDNKAFAATVINMAVKGYLLIEEHGREYTLRKTGKNAPLLSAEETDLAESLFGKADKIILKNENHEKISRAIGKLKNILKQSCEKVYFITNQQYFTKGVLLSFLVFLLTIVSTALGKSPEKLFTAIFMSVWLSVWTFGVGALLATMVVSWKTTLSSRGGTGLGTAIFFTLFSLPFVVFELIGLGVFGFAVSALVAFIILSIILLNFVFFHLLKAPTDRGRRIMDKIEGFRMYLGVAEKDRLNLLNPPEKTPELFEKYLPYALALDVEQAWSEKFASVLAKASQEGREYAPTWYSGAHWHDFGSGGFATSFGSALANTISSSSHPPGSSSGGGGGGCSGGGGGGGGGGGW